MSWTTVPEPAARYLIGLAVRHRGATGERRLMIEHKIEASFETLRAIESIKKADLDWFENLIYRLGSGDLASDAIELSKNA